MRQPVGVAAAARSPPARRSGGGSGPSPRRAGPRSRPARTGRRRAGQPAQEAGVDRLVDADREHAHARAAGAGSRRIWSSLPTWPSVTSTSTRSRSPVSVEQAERLLQRREHLGAAARVDPGQVLDRAEAVAVGRLRPGPAGSVGGCSTMLSKASTANRSRVGQRVDHAGGGAPGGDHLPAAHAARAVEHAAPRRAAGPARSPVGGSTVSRNVPSSPVGVGRAASSAWLAAPPRRRPGAG